MRRPKNLLPTSIALVALVVAGTGTAVAATTTTTISDPTNSSYVAHVNSSGQLQVSGPVSVSAPGVPFLTYTPVENVIETGDYSAVLGPTTATLALTQLDFLSVDGKAWVDDLYEAAASSSKTCGDTVGSPDPIVAEQEAQPDANDSETLVPPFVVKPLKAGQAYCLFAAAAPTDNTASTDTAEIDVRGYVISGTAPSPSPSGVKALAGAAH
jgi:hypothetical protein